MPEPPRRRPEGGQDPPEHDDEAWARTGPIDITKLETAYLVPPEPLRGIRASREDQLVAHQAAEEHLRQQQRTLVRQVTDWQNQMYGEPPTSPRRSEIQRQIDELWAVWSELERQAVAHRQAMQVLRAPDPLPPEQGG
jgi:hypothetical protein